MFLLKFSIFLSLFLLTKQELFWNFLSSNEFSTNKKVPTLDLSKFSTLDNSQSINLTLCILFLSIGYAYLDYDRTGCSKCSHVNSTNNLTINSKSCNVHGIMKKAHFLRSYDHKEELIFISFDGCYTINPNGSNLTGTLLVTNNITISYNKILNTTHYWKDLKTKYQQCNMLCKDVIIDRCYVEQTEADKKYLIRMFKLSGDKFEWMKPLEGETKMSNWYSDHQQIIAIKFGIISGIILISLIIYKYGINKVSPYPK